MTIKKFPLGKYLKDLMYPNETENKMVKNNGSKVMESDSILIEQYLRELHQLKLDITKDYDDWIKLGFAFASLGELGRGFFHEVSSLYPNYSTDECNNVFDDLLERHDGSTSIKSFFFLAERAIESSNNHSDEIAALPSSIYNDLPEFLKEVCDGFAGAERDMILISSLGVLSSCFPNYKTKFRKEELEANLFIFIVGPPGCGKGCTKWARKLAEGVHQDRKQDSNEQGEQKFHYIPANTSASALYWALDICDGRGIIFSSEADSLSTALGQDWGNFSDLLRQAYHHEPFSLLRKTNKEYYEIQNPCLSVVLTGTPDQVARLIPSIENGLYSRFSFHIVSQSNNTDNLLEDNKDTDFSKIFDELSSKVLKLHTRLYNRSETPLHFELSNEQVERLQELLESWTNLTEKEIGPLGISISRRHIIMVLRVCMTISILRYIDTQLSEKSIEPIYSDFETSIKLVEHLLSCSIRQYELMPATTNPKTNMEVKVEKLQNALPYKFSRKETISTAKRIGISRATADRMLSNTSYFRKIDHGQYTKTRKV